MRIEVVTGTDTDVGKTWATAALAVRALADGLRVHVDKPVQTGVRPVDGVGHGGDGAADGVRPGGDGPDDGDVQTVRRLVGRAAQEGLLDEAAVGRLSVSEGMRLGPAMAPLDAVAEETARQTVPAGGPSGTPARPSLPTLAEQVGRWRALARGVDLLLVEGAGGVTVAWTDADEGPVDAVLALRAAGCEAGLTVVARPGLGTQNHARLTVEHAALRGVAPGRLLVSGTAAEPDAVETANLRFLARLAAAHGAVCEAVPWGEPVPRRV